ncbi:DEAD/DEAH box helicase [Phytoactinopolyspora halophila]|nr:DEAD/DEAH box helicase [Phytoactinopolyspora halophila]
MTLNQSTLSPKRPARRNGAASQRNERRGEQRFSGNRKRRGGPTRDRQGADPARQAAIDEFDVTTSAFTTLGAPERIVKILGVDGVVEPTAVQAAVIPDALQGRDVLGRARTGSGKTLAFGLPILMRLAGNKSRPNHPRAFVIVPTRELAKQVTGALEPLAEALRLRMATIYGGAPYDRQIRRLDRAADIVVATPGRLNDLVERGACHLDEAEIVTLDEADHLCDLGFFPVVDELLGQTPAGGQRMLLSATLDGDVDRLVKRHLSDPARHEIDPDAGSIETMDHHVLVVGSHNKLRTTAALLHANPRSIVFTRTKSGATQLAEELEGAGVTAVDLHGDLSQRVRERNLDRFRRRQVTTVVATDVAARGIHVDGIDLVVHFDPAGEAKSYLHRSGRTARAGASGAVVTMATAGQARGLGDLFRRAGVEARHVDARSVTGGPMTVESLADAPEMADKAPSQRGDRNGNGAGRPRRSSGRSQGRGRPGPRRSGPRVRS